MRHPGNILRCATMRWMHVSLDGIIVGGYDNAIEEQRVRAVGMVMGKTVDDHSGWTIS